MKGKQVDKNKKQKLNYAKKNWSKNYKKYEKQEEILGQRNSYSKTLTPHLEEFKNQFNALPEKLTADAGYGSEENYEYLEDKEIEAYVKYNYFHIEQHKKGKETPDFHQDKLFTIKIKIFMSVLWDKK